MKTSLTLLFGLLSLFVLCDTVYGIQANYGSSATVTTATQTYTYGTAGTNPTLAISSAAATGTTSTVTVGLFTALPSITVTGAAGISSKVFTLPSGYASLTVGAGAVGYTIAFSSDINGQATGTFTITPVYAGGYAAFKLSGSALGLLTYDATAQVYGVIPSSLYTVSSTGDISLTVTSSTTFVVASSSLALNTAPITSAVGYLFWLAANTSSNFVITESGNAVLKINNLRAAAGGFAVEVSASASAEGSIATSSGKVLVSKVYTFAHSSGNSAVQSADLVYDTQFSAAASASYNVNNARWFKFNTNTNLWVEQGGSVSGSVVTYTTTGFSDWSVQSAGFTLYSASCTLILLLITATLAVTGSY